MRTRSIDARSVLCYNAVRIAQFSAVAARFGVNQAVFGYMRRERIRQTIAARREASVSDLSRLLGVSPSTIRRDLERLRQEGLLERHHGGATAPNVPPSPPELPIFQRTAQQAAEKRAIGLAAAELVQDGSVIGIESGSTSLELARALAQRSWQSLHVVTNSFAVVNELVRAPGVHMVFVGGSVNPGEMGTFGSMAEEMLRRVNIDRLFMTCRGLDPRAGLSNDSSAESTLSAERALVRSSREVIVLADHTKFGRVFPLQSVPVADLNTVITDSLAPGELVEELRRQGVQVIVAAVPEAAHGPQTREES